MKDKCRHGDPDRIMEHAEAGYCLSHSEELHLCKYTRSLSSDLAEKTNQVERLWEALTNIHDYGIDRDGETTSEKLGELVDELVQLARDALAATAPKEE